MPSQTFAKSITEVQEGEKPEEQATDPQCFLEGPLVLDGDAQTTGGTSLETGPIRVDSRAAAQTEVDQRMKAKHRGHKRRVITFLDTG